MGNGGNSTEGIIILGSGPSAKGFKKPPGIPVIAVNGAIDRVPTADFFFTLDPSPLNIERLERYHDKVECVGAFPAESLDDYPHIQENITILERISQHYDGPINDNKRDETLSPGYWFERWGCIRGLSEDKNKIHTGNSAYGAMGLAYHLNYTKVLLVGIDATNEPRIEGGKPNNLSHLSMLFNSARRQINFKSCGKMKDVPTIELEDGLEWVRGTETEKNIVVEQSKDTIVDVALVLRSGGCYGEEYVSRIAQSLKRSITVPHKLSLLTDMTNLDIPSYINVIPLKKDFTGWWSKLELFDNFKGKTVYLDLDTLVIRNIDWLLLYDTQFTCLTDLLHPKFHGTGIMAWNGDFSYLSEGFNMSMDSMYRQTGNWGDQGYIIDKLHITPSRLQDTFPHHVASYKQSTPVQKKMASIICYHGKPRPHETNWEMW